MFDYRYASTPNSFLRQFRRHKEFVAANFREEPRKRSGSLDSQTLMLEHFFERERQLKEMLNMAQKKEKAAPWVGFVDVKLTAEQDAAFDVWDATDEDVITLLQEANSGGYKLSVVWNGSNSTFIASLTCTDKDIVNAGYTMPAFSSSWYEAIRLLVFKHFYVTEGNWLEHTGGTRSTRG